MKSLYFCFVPSILLCSVGTLAQTPSAMPDQATSPPAAMSKMGDMPMSSDSDKNFAMMMKMHHQKGLEMAKKELAEGKSPQMKAMAQKIIDAQTKEVAEFAKWLATHGG